MRLLLGCHQDGIGAATPALVLRRRFQPRKVMPKVRLNTALTGISGKIDEYVFKVYRGRTLLSKKPTFTKPWSEGQGDWRKTFSAASGFAALIKEDPELRERYRRRGKRLKLNYRQMALRDYFHPPEIEWLTTTHYRPAEGGTLEIGARDDFEVVAVQVTLRGADGAVILSGDAIPARRVWHFDVPVPGPGARNPTAVEISARDRPGNVSTRTFSLP